MAFDAASLLSDLFPGQPPARAPAEPEEASPPPPQPCYWCGGAVFWLSTLGAYRCGNCHPPAYPELVQMWLRVVPTEDGPQVVRLGNPPSKA
jgi:hypothetical protein